MSAPSRRRTVARMPCASSVRAKAATAASSARVKPVSATSFTGIRLTWIGILSVRVRRWRLSTSASCRAAATESFLPAISVYSNEIRRPVCP